MPTKAEVLAEIHKRGLQSPQKKAVFAEIQRRKLREQAVTSPFQTQAQETAGGIGGLFKTGAISTGRGLFKIGRALGLAEPETEAERQAFKALKKERPVTTFAGEVVGEALPFAAIPVGAIPGTVGRVAAATGLGITEGALIAKGEGREIGTQIQAGGIGGTLAGVSEVLIPHIGRIGGKIIRKVTGKAPKGALVTPQGMPTQELTQALDGAGLTFDDLVEGSIDLLKKPSNLTPDQAARKAFLESQGFVGETAPTLPQITREATDFQMQQEAVKTSGKVRGRIENQEALLTNKFDETIAGTGGDPVSSGSPVHDYIQNKSTVLDNQIHNLYKMAENKLQTGELVNLSNTFNRLKQMRPSDALMGHPIKAIEGEAARLGLLDAEKGMLRKATVAEAELLRKFSNQIFNSVSDFGRTGLREFRDVIDSDVTMSAGEDIFNQARKAKSTFEKDLSTAKLSKFSKRKVNVIRDILDDKIGADEVFNKVMLGKKYRKEDIKSLKKYMLSGNPKQKIEGKKAFDDLKAETVEWIKNNAFIGPEDAAGNRAISRDKLEKSISRIGLPKMREMFNKNELNFFRDMIKITKIREPVRGTAIGKGPSAQGISAAIGSLKRRIDKIPVLNIFVDLDLDPTGKTVLRAKPKRIIEQPKIDLPIPQIAGAGGVALTTQQGETNE